VLAGVRTSREQERQANTDQGRCRGLGEEVSKSRRPSLCPCDSGQHPKIVWRSWKRHALGGDRKRKRKKNKQTHDTDTRRWLGFTGQRGAAPLEFTGDASRRTWGRASDSRGTIGSAGAVLLCGAPSPREPRHNSRDWGFVAIGFGCAATGDVLETFCVWWALSGIPGCRVAGALARAIPVEPRLIAVISLSGNRRGFGGLQQVAVGRGVTSQPRQFRLPSPPFPMPPSGLAQTGHQALPCCRVPVHTPQLTSLVWLRVSGWRPWGCLGASRREFHMQATRFCGAAVVRWSLTAAKPRNFGGGGCCQL
jgi:hypothetical protein